MQKMCLRTRVQFHKAWKHKNLLSTENSCLAKIGYQSKNCTFTFAVTGIPLTSCLANNFAEQNFLPNRFKKLGPCLMRQFTGNHFQANSKKKLGHISIVTLFSGIVKYFQKEKCLLWERRIHWLHPRYMKNCPHLTRFEEKVVDSHTCWCTALVIKLTH